MCLELKAQMNKKWILGVGKVETNRQRVIRGSTILFHERTCNTLYRTAKDIKESQKQWPFEEEILRVNAQAALECIPRHSA